MEKMEIKKNKFEIFYFIENEFFVLKDKNYLSHKQKTKFGIIIKEYQILFPEEFFFILKKKNTKIILKITDSKIKLDVLKKNNLDFSKLICLEILENKSEIEKFIFNINSFFTNLAILNFYYQKKIKISFFQRNVQNKFFNKNSFFLDFQKIIFFEYKNYKDLKNQNFDIIHLVFFFYHDFDLKFFLNLKKEFPKRKIILNVLSSNSFNQFEICNLFNTKKFLF